MRVVRPSLLIRSSDDGCANRSTSAPPWLALLPSAVSFSLGRLSLCKGTTPGHSRLGRYGPLNLSRLCITLTATLAWDLATVICRAHLGYALHSRSGPSVVRGARNSRLVHSACVPGSNPQLMAHRSQTLGKCCILLCTSRIARGGTTQIVHQVSSDTKAPI